MTLRTLNYGNYGIFLIMGSAGFCPSTVTTIIGQTLILNPKLRARPCTWDDMAAQHDEIQSQAGIFILRGFR